MNNSNDVDWSNDAKHLCMNWIIEHCATNNNTNLLSTIYSHHPLYKNNNQHNNNKTGKILNISLLRNFITTTSYNNLSPTVLNTSGSASKQSIITHYHQLYPSLNVSKIKSLSSSERDQLSEWCAKLFQIEIELKVQCILSTNYWKNDYISHKKINDALLHLNRYSNNNNNRNSNSNSNSNDNDIFSEFIPPAPVILYLQKCANGFTFIKRIYQQMDYLGQQCTKKDIDLTNKNDATVKRIHSFLSKHNFNNFVKDFLNILNEYQFKYGVIQKKDFISRLVRADIQKIIDVSDQNIIRDSDGDSSSSSDDGDDGIISKYGLRTVVDVCIRDDWCQGTIIKKECGGIIVVALHEPQLDLNGYYQYDTHIRVKDMNRIVHCVNEDGQYEMDDNPNCIVVNKKSLNSLYSSPIKQEIIRREKLSQSQASQASQSPLNTFRSPPKPQPKKRIVYKANRISLPDVIAERSKRKQYNADINVENATNALSEMNIDDTDSDNELDMIQNVSQQIDDNDKAMPDRYITALNSNAHPSQSTDITEPTASGSGSANSNSNLSPNSINKERIKRINKLRIQNNDNNDDDKNNNNNNRGLNRRRRSRSNRRQSTSSDNLNPNRIRKRSREQFEENQTKNNKLNTKRRKIITRSVTKEQKEKEKELNKKKQLSPQRRSPRLIEKRKSMINNKNNNKIQTKNKNNKNKNKNKIQTKIIGKNKQISYSKNKNKNKNRNNNNNNNDGGDGGLEIEWEDEEDDETMASLKKSAILSKKKKHKGPQKSGKWTQQQENALKECYTKHAKIRKETIGNYAIWDLIKRDPNYCSNWRDRSANALRDKARALGIYKKQ